MPFEFIDNNTFPNDAARKIIRTHAALGRNKGKRLTRPSRKDASRTTTTPFHVPAIVAKASKFEESLEIERTESPERPVDDGLVFPGLLPGETKSLVKNGLSRLVHILPISYAQCREG